MPFNALEEFKGFLTLVAPLLRDHGFSRRGQNFYTRRDGNWGVINFQKSQSSTPAKVRFMLNLGVYSQVLAKFYFTWKDGTPPTESSCHWRKRIASGSNIGYWQIDETTSLSSLVEEFGEILPLAASEIDNHITDEALRDHLLSISGAGGLSNSAQLEDLSVLVKRYGPFDMLDSILADLRNSGVSHVVEGHIERLKGSKATD